MVLTHFHLRDQKIPLFITSLKLNRSFAPRLSMVIDETLLLKLVTASAQLQFPEVYRPLYLLAFFSSLRLSNILPHTVNTFDKTRHLCVGDVIFSNYRAVFLIKWSKTFQDRVKATTLDIQSLGSSALSCECLAWNAGQDSFQSRFSYLSWPAIQASY